jgi:hypothetical protein
MNELFQEYVPISENKNLGIEETIQKVFIEYINRIEGWKSKCKNLHWSAPKKNIHVYLDDFLSELSDFQDSITEDYMGINGKVAPNILTGYSCMALNAFDLIAEIKIQTEIFYKKLPTDICYKGITAECENFIHIINKYTYLFKLTDYKSDMY